MRWEYFHGWPIIQHQWWNTGGTSSLPSLAFTLSIAFPLSPLTLNLSLYHLSFSSAAFFASLWPNYFFPLPAPPALCLSLFLYIVWYNFPSSFGITPRISFFAPLIFSCAHTLAAFSPNRVLLAALPVRFCRLHIWLPWGSALVSLSETWVSANR